MAIAEETFTETLKGQAQQLGFVLGGVTLAASPLRLQSFHAWLDAGYAGQMHYLSERRDAYSHPRNVLDGCRTILMLAMPYGAFDPSPGSHGAGTSSGKIARYAQSTIDYHDVIHKRLKDLCSWTLARFPSAAVRGVVDTAPLLERELAEAAGLGWVGKNTLLLNRQWGSAFFLAALLTDLELQPDAAYEHGYCGTCTACLDACPTRAFPEPFVLDATRCISYLTIEHRGDIDDALRSQLDGWAFGCDVCQEVCPWNRHAQKIGAAESVEPALLPRDDLRGLDLVEVLELSDEQFRQRFRQTALWRAKRRGLLRNAILIAGTRKIPAAHPALIRLTQDPEPIVQQAAKWALARFAAP